MTNKDLQQISDLLDQKLDQKLEPINKRLDSHEKILVSHDKQLKTQTKLLKSLKKDQNTMLNMLDTEQMNQKKRISGIEKHLGHSPQIS